MSITVACAGAHHTGETFHTHAFGIALVDLRCQQDVTAWCLLAVVISIAQAGLDPQRPSSKIAFLAAYMVSCTLSRPSVPSHGGRRLS